MLKVNMIFLGDEFLKGKDIVNEVIGESIIKGLEDKKEKIKLQKIGYRNEISNIEYSTYYNLAFNYKNLGEIREECNHLINNIKESVHCIFIYISKFYKVLENNYIRELNCINNNSNVPVVIITADNKSIENISVIKKLKVVSFEDFTKDEINKILYKSIWSSYKKNVPEKFSNFCIRNIFCIMNKLRVEAKDSNYNEDICKSIIKRTKGEFNKGLFSEMKGYILDVNTIIKKFKPLYYKNGYIFDLTSKNLQDDTLKKGDESEIGKLMDSINFEEEKNSYGIMGAIFKAGYGGISKTQKTEEEISILENEFIIISYKLKKYLENSFYEYEKKYYGKVYRNDVK
ncbi:MAG: hypothetical protein ACRCVJ_07310 [Clostridium sp.]|uniref:hypothetical protein n=1 Tax=Clostridium sp. TaxID=1506 RepID=UPI003F3F46B4